MSFSVMGVGSALPEHVVTNDMLSGFLDTSDEWITTRTGIKERRVVTTETLAELSATAAKRALAMAGIEAAQLSYILCATTSADYAIPSLACQVQQLLGASCPAMDANAACTGFLYALDMADALFARDPNARVLVIGAEAMSRLVDWNDRSTAVLFGDGAGALVLGLGSDLKSMLVTAVGDPDPLYARHADGNSPYAVKRERAPLRMDGHAGYRFAVPTIVRDVSAAIARAGMTEDDIDAVLLHQANLRIVDAAAQRLNIPRDKFKTNIQSRGNTSAASIPILMDELHREGQLPQGSVLALAAFGGGLTTGACVLAWGVS
ncbi:MAG: ketoacyl-ACP synthase III [Clostridiales bacterium]|nr:ketoacyl-ACP synthase III [Clostridiales bacterium]